MEEIKDFHPQMHVFICVNERTNGTASCSPTISVEMVREVKQWINHQGLSTEVYCTRVGCLGFCNPDGGVMCIWPQGRFLKGIRTLEEIKQVISEEVNKLG